ncbi:MAG: SAM-dependent methyltransferase [Planctomycetota bacterium]|jgi:SAM-dependent methyltransferase
MTVDDEWYKRAFNADYSAIYAHRDDSSATKEVRWSLGQMSVPNEGSVLDLCCGNGRHTVQLANEGFRVTAVDLSIPLLQQTMSRRINGAHVACADMRNLPLKSGSMDAVFSFFTSFGYFQEDQTNAGVLCEIARVLKNGGKVLFDFLNADYVRQNLVPISRDEKEGTVLEQTRRITDDGTRVEKTVVFTQPGQLVEKYTESVRLFSQEELVVLFEDAGLSTTNFYGDFEGSLFTSGSPRLVCFAQKEGSLL